MKKKHIPYCFAIILACNFVAFANDRGKVEKELQSELGGRLLTLRKPCASDRLRFSPDGQLIGTAADLPWTTGGLLKVTKISVKTDHLEIEGIRVLIAWRSDAAPPSLLPLLTNGNIKVVVESDIAISDTAQAKHLLAKVFQGQNIDQRIAGYWKPDPATAPNVVQSRIGILEGNRYVYRVHLGEVEPPRPLHTPDPHYTPNARLSGLQGTTVLKVILNENGSPEIIEISKALGEGLDLEALDAVSQWRFDPATMNGKPVAVMINVQVNFKLY
jgi:TonB family protein